ncbi:hypothetical protein FB451DRAFT_1241824 [Mycena latifolia]|nr:hypothetical protein FB451DRAFT_1241824 [Mycena latifolia]
MPPKHGLRTLDGAPLASLLETTLHQSGHAASKLRSELLRLEEEVRKARDLRLAAEKERDDQGGEVSREKRERKVAEEAVNGAEKARKAAVNAQRVDKASWEERERVLIREQRDRRRMLMSQWFEVVQQMQEQERYYSMYFRLTEAAASRKRPSTEDTPDEGPLSKRSRQTKRPAPDRRSSIS